MKRETIKFALQTALALTAVLGVSTASAYASSSLSQNVNAECQSNVWQEDDKEMASVLLNGKEIAQFCGNLGEGKAEAKADDLARKLQDLLNDKKFDGNKLMPIKSGQQVAMQFDHNAVVSFDMPEKPAQEQIAPLTVAWKLVNDIRASFGALTLPASYLKLIDQSDSKIVIEPGTNGHFSGQASWYGPSFHGKRTSDGHRFDQEKLTAAHRSLPFGTKLLVMNRKTGHSCVVEVNDRGPFVGNRVIDLSKAAARELNMLSSGVAFVDCLVLNNNSSSQ